MAAGRATAQARGRLWLLLALLLFSLGGALTALYQKPDPPPPRVVLPRAMDDVACASGTVRPRPPPATTSGRPRPATR